MIHFTQDEVFKLKLKFLLTNHDPALLLTVIKDHKTNWPVTYVWKEINFDWEWFYGSFASLSSVVEMVHGLAEADQMMNEIRDWLIELLEGMV